MENEDLEVIRSSISSVIAMAVGLLQLQCPEIAN